MVPKHSHRPIPTGTIDVTDHPPLLDVDISGASYGTAQVLHGVSFSMSRERVAIIGRNGMGKSTLCNVITGLHRDAHGTVELDGQQVLGRRPMTIGRAGVGYVPQGRRVFDSLTVDEHFSMLGPRQSDDWPTTAIYDLFPQLGQRRRSLARDLSGGEQQMLAISRAVATGPKLLVMDEPSEGLAPLVVDDLIDQCAALFDDAGIGILVIEQNLHAALRIADRVLVMVRGETLTDMSSADFSTRTDLQEAHLGVSRTT
ncbi:MAG: ABC transporter ATP-binding protein [Acidimicrobiales bacterium]|nr:ABC transporter ATP-binding protein [Acidimicrobiales bacterium]MYD84137.1 ABC transporter ATP-binding protein [Acidimicrobiales bacterium]MYJ65272.1 ABC transporter ATP-binding protein [Acidimicrobiales bacterium]